jgi:hypothetical protein
MSDATAIRKEFLGRIAFRPSARKLDSCMRFLRMAWPHGSAADLRLALLIAEGSHVSAYGRPVTGCQYLLSDGVVSLSGQGEGPDISSSNDDPELTHRIHDIDAMEEAFPNLSGSDIEHMTRAAMRCAADRDGVMAAADAWLHDGRVDYALMVEEADAERLQHKLEDLSAWGRYFYLGK